MFRNSNVNKIVQFFLVSREIITIKKSHEQKKEAGTNFVLLC